MVIYSIANNRGRKEVVKQVSGLRLDIAEFIANYMVDLKLKKTEPKILGQFSVYTIGICRYNFNKLDLQNYTDLWNGDLSIRELSGNFAIILVSGQEMRCFTDIVASYPLYYRVHNCCLEVTDQLQLNEYDFTKDDSLIQQFKSFGFVLGDECLAEGFKRMGCYECLYWDGLNLSITSLVPSGVFFDEISSYENYASALLDSIAALISVQGNSQLIVPLSGGYDSRSILAALSRLGAKNVVCFTYGDDLSDEVEISRELARIVGYPWHYVEYSEDFCKSLEDQRIDYENFAFNYSSLPHVQDFYAIYKLTRQGIINKNDIVVPGHSADYSAGSHIPIHSFDKSSFSFEDLYKDLLEFHRIGSREKLCNASLREYLIRGNSSLDFEDYRREFELFDYRERQSKLTVNSIRIYDYFELNTFLPLWSFDLKRQLMSITGSDRKNCSKYREWVVRFCLESGIQDMSRNREVSNGYVRLQKLFRNLGLLKAFRLVRNIYRILFDKKALNRDGTYALAYTNRMRLNRALVSGRNVVGVYLLFFQRRIGL